MAQKPPTTNTGIHRRIAPTAKLPSEASEDILASPFDREAWIAGEAKTLRGKIAKNVDLRLRLVGLGILWEDIAEEIAKKPDKEATVLVFPAAIPDLARDQLDLFRTETQMIEMAEYYRLEYESGNDPLTGKPLKGAALEECNKANERDAGPGPVLHHRYAAGSKLDALTLFFSDERDCFADFGEFEDSLD